MARELIGVWRLCQDFSNRPSVGSRYSVSLLNVASVRFLKAKFGKFVIESHEAATFAAPCRSFVGVLLVHSEGPCCTHRMKRLWLALAVLLAICLVAHALPTITERMETYDNRSYFGLMFVRHLHHRRRFN